MTLDPDAAQLELVASMAGPIRSRTCYWALCSDCGENCWDEEGTPHFDSVDELRESLIRHWSWTFEHGRPLCRACSHSADCDRDGHQFEEWWPRPSDPAVLLRSCAHCGHVDETLAGLLEGDGGPR